MRVKGIKRDLYTACIRRRLSVAGWLTFIYLGHECVIWRYVSGRVSGTNMDLYSTGFYTL